MSPSSFTYKTYMWHTIFLTRFSGRSLGMGHTKLFCSQPSPPSSFNNKSPKYLIHAQYQLSLQIPRDLKLWLISELLRVFCVPLLFPLVSPSSQLNTYHLFQDLQLTDHAVVSFHPIVPNHYTLLSIIPSETSHLSVLDFKGTLFSIPLDPYHKIPLPDFD